MSTHIRVALAESGRTAKSVYTAADIGEATWYRRMAEDGTWRLSELRRVADEMGYTVGALIDG